MAPYDNTLVGTQEERPEGIAVIGMSCQFPGARELEQFWDNLHHGVESIRVLTDEEMRADGVDPRLLERSDYVKMGAVLERIEWFDADFFGLSPREAVLMDPQHRLFIEYVWKALEHSGYAPQTCPGQIGVYGGTTMSSYLHHQLARARGAESAVNDLQVYIANDKDYLTTRVSYLLNLTGPSICVQTACSTSLVAVAIACDHLLDRQCDLAVAGGVTVRVPHRAGYLYTTGGVLSPDGHCRSFDAQAQGTMFGNGVGVVALKRLEDALAHGDTIYAVIKGHAVNNEGAHKIGYTAPSLIGQAEVIAMAQSMAGFPPETITMIEAHGAGTRLGDPIEVAALTQVFRAQTEHKGFCALGSVKTNLGHLEAAAGIASLIKTVLALHHKTLPPSLHYEQANPDIAFASSPFYVNTVARAWEPDGCPRRAGVSSFGIGGTNVHLVLEEAPPRATVHDEPARPMHVLTITAKCDKALTELVARHAACLSRQPEISLADYCFTANAGRAHFEHRLACSADTPASMAQRLDAYRDGHMEEASVAAGTVRAGATRKLVFLFTGQGSQYLDMGRQLYDTQPTFRRIMNHCDHVLRAHLERPLLEVLYGGTDAELLHETAYTQPALFALEYALAELWRSWNVLPMAVMGHSVGEYAAACCAGVFSLEDGLRLIAARGRLIQALPRTGAMAAVFVPLDRVTAAIRHAPRQLSIAAINGPNAVVVSGHRQALSTLVTAFEQEGVRVEFLRISHAFHSPLMAPALPEFRRIAATVTYHRPTLDFISCLTGRSVTDELSGPDYWVRHISEPVDFAASMASLQHAGYDTMLEIGPRATLLGMGRTCLPEGYGLWLPSMRRDREWPELLDSLGQLYVHGVPIDWQAFDADYRRTRLAIPGYPLQRRRFWADASTTRPTSAEPHDDAAGETAQPLLGRPLPLPWSRETRFATRYTAHRPAYLDDHRLFGTLVVPAASHIAAFLAALEATQGPGPCLLTETVFPEPLILDDTQARPVQVIVTPESDTATVLRLVALRSDASEERPDAWALHAVGYAHGVPAAADPPLAADWTAVQERCTQRLDGAVFYHNLARQGYTFGPHFQWIRTVLQGEDDVLCEVRHPDIGDTAYPLHPGLIDVFFQLPACLVSTAPTTADHHIFLPFRIARFAFHRRVGSGPLWCHVQRRQTQDGPPPTLRIDARLLEADGSILAEITGFEARQLDGAKLGAPLPQEVDAWLYQPVWEPVALSLEPSPHLEPGSWLILADRGGVGEALATRLSHAGHRPITVFAGADFARHGDGTYGIDPEQPGDWQRLMAETLTRDTLPWHGIVHLWSLDSTPLDEDHLQPIAHVWDNGLGSALHLIQTLASCDWSQPPRLRLVTRGAQAVHGTSPAVDASAAALWGLGLTMTLEYPMFTCTLIDLDPHQPVVQHEANRLCAELLTGDAASQMAYRGNQRFIPRLEPHARPSTRRELVLSDQATYLVTGGLGALGLLTAQWLVHHGARHLVLVGRSAPVAEALEAVAALRLAGADVRVMRADIAVAEEVQALLAETARCMPPLRGIVHAAGVLDDGVLLRQTRERFATVMAPKVAGTWFLHAYTRHMSLDFFVCYSSTVGVLGMPGQGNYAVANACMDGLVLVRRALGLPALSVAWSAWAGAGMAAHSRATARRLDSATVPEIRSEQGLAILERLLPSDIATIVVSPSPPEALAARPTTSASPQQLGAQLAQLSPSAARTRLVQEVLRTASRVVGLTDAEGLAPEERFFEKGMDSLMALDLADRLGRSLGKALPPTLIFDYPTAATLVAHLLELLSLAQTPAAAPALPPERSPHTAGDLTQLSEDELEALLLEKIQSVQAGRHL